MNMGPFSKNCLLLQDNPKFKKLITQNERKKVRNFPRSPLLRHYAKAKP
jgi:hypothetical protein